MLGKSLEFDISGGLSERELMANSDSQGEGLVRDGGLVQMLQ